jgi:electron transport complex protein RnfD
MHDKRIGIIEKPQINISFPTAGRMWVIFFCAFLCVIQSAFTDSGASLVLASLSLLTAVLTELLITWKISGFGKIKDGSAAAAALVFTLLLPNQINPVYAVIGTVFAVAVVKHSFGGLGSNWLNPAIGGWLFIRFSWPGAFTLPDYYLQTNSQFDFFITSFLNNTIFSITGAQMPVGYIDLLFSKNPGIIADRGLFALLTGTIIIIVLKISRYWVPLAFLVVFSLLTKFAGNLPFYGQLWEGDVLFGLFSGGTIAAAFILASEPATGAKSKPGMFLVVILGAVLSWVFRYLSMEYSGCFIALAFVNSLTPAVRYFEKKLIFSSSGAIQEGRT